MKHMTCIGVLVGLLLIVTGMNPTSTVAQEDAGTTKNPAAEAPYDYTTSPAWKNLSDEERDGIDRVSRDFVLLWGAIDMHVQSHGGQLPDSLGDLVPGVLQSLPIDPFASDGSTYGYRQGAPGNYAYCLLSAGLPSFPYLAASGNTGLHLCRGNWISGMNPEGGNPLLEIAPRPGRINHVVLMKLKDPAEAGALIRECRERLATIPCVESAFTGRHGDFGRSNIDGEYDVGFFVAFDTREDYMEYVDHPEHTSLVKRWKPRFEWIRIHDVVDEGS